MSVSNMALLRRNAELEQYNLELRVALARTTRQLAETLEEYKLLRIPFFRRWRVRRLMRRRKAEQLAQMAKAQKEASLPGIEGGMVCRHCHRAITEVLTSYPPKCPLCLQPDPLGDSPPLGSEPAETTNPTDRVPLIVIPGRG